MSPRETIWAASKATRVRECDEIKGEKKEEIKKQETVSNVPAEIIVDAVLGEACAPLLRQEGGRKLVRVTRPLGTNCVLYCTRQCRITRRMDPFIKKWRNCRVL